MIRLRQYQLDNASKGLEILRKYWIVYLALETRTGKTLTALEIARRTGLKKVLFVTKKKAIQSIESDYQKMNPDFELTVINYESVTKVGSNFDLIIADEAHGMGAFPKPAKRVKDLKPIAYGKPIIYLSATPTPESWSQIYHQFYISHKSPFAGYKTFYKWANDFVEKRKKYVYNREINDYTHANIVLIKKYTKHLFLTYTQKQAGFEVKLKEEILTVPMPDNIKHIIKKVEQENCYLNNGFEIVADTAVKVMQKVHQLCSGTVIDENDYHIVSTFKADYLKDNFEGQRIAIFYKFKSEYEMLKMAFPDYTDNAFDFQNGKGNVFLGQFVSAREGIRLDNADAIIFFNIDFSFLSYEQARNRIVSFEREKEAVLYWLFSDIGIEPKIYKAVNNKKDYTLQHYRHERISF
jgi:hypothetical protein